VTELVARTELSRPTVDAAADELVRLGWLEELEVEPQRRRGRPARTLAFRAQAGYVAGLDIGEVKVRTAVANLSGSIVAERVHDFVGTDRLPEVKDAMTATLDEAGLRRNDLLRACIGCTGAMDTPRGRVLFSSIFPDGFELAAALEPILGPATVENDCNLAVIAERWQGAAQGADDVVCVLAGERMGAGIMVGGHLIRGHAGAAGELAFLGAYEHDHGARGIAQLVRELANDAPETVFAAAADGDPQAMEIVERAERWAGQAIVTTAQIVNPEVVVIGGGVARAGEVQLAPLRARRERMVRLPPRLVASPLAERGPLLGALKLSLDELAPRLLDPLDEAA
jgi:predicted NBD/HSP70 family sugar kinase